MSRRTASRLLKGWHNEGFSADSAYLSAVMKYAFAARGNILECGSGATTLLLAATAERTGTRVHALEHMPEWRDRVRTALQRFSLAAEVHLAPLVQHGPFNWYEIPEQLPKDFALVICDGPPSTTLGGRYGLLPCLHRHLRGAVILMDDAERSGEQEILARWQQEFGLEFHIVEPGIYAVAKLPA